MRGATFSNVCTKSTSPEQPCNYIYIIVCDISWRKGETIGGKGSNSKVYQGIDMNTGKIIAIKTIEVRY